jgi:LEA14-like dessication related protein
MARPGLRTPRHRRLVALALLPVALLVGGCSVLDLARLVAPQIDLVGVNLDQVGLLRSVIELELEIDNPNPFRLPIERGAYTLFLGGSRVGTGATRGFVDIPARSSSNQAIVIELDNLELVRRLSTLFDEEVAYRIEAEHVVRGLGGQSLRSVSEGDVDLRSGSRRGV